MSYGRWVEAEKALKQEGPVIKTDKGNLVTNPFLWVANREREMIYKFLSEFGMTPASRSRIRVELSRQKDDFDKFMEKK